MSKWPEVAKQLDLLVNQSVRDARNQTHADRAFDSDAACLPPPAHDFFGNNRRDCWAAVACTAPLDVKRAIWEHEKKRVDLRSAHGQGACDRRRFRAAIRNPI